MMTSVLEANVFFAFISVFSVMSVFRCTLNWRCLYIESVHITAIRIKIWFGLVWTSDNLSSLEPILWVAHL